MAYIEIIGVSKRYAPHKQNGVETVALENVSLEIDKGNLVSIVGPSGCGKSTLLQIIAGLVSSSSGSVLLNGLSVEGPPFEMIYVFQQYTKSIFPWKSVSENVAFGLRNRKHLSSAALHAQCAEYISLVELCGFEEHYPWQLSGGMQQRVALARGLICQPDILLMDEPFSSVDAMTRAGLQDLLLRLWDDFSLTVLFVTHDVDEAIYLAERVVVMSASSGPFVDDLDIALPYPRSQLVTRESPAYSDYRRRIHQKIFCEKAVLANNIQGVGL